MDEDSSSDVEKALEKLADKDLFEKQYNVKNKGVLLFAMGDGNHSLATAKQCYENLKKEIGEDAALAHPSRFALVEIVNLHSPALVFEPIHRVVFNVDTQDLINEMTDTLGLSETDGEQKFSYIVNGIEYTTSITKPSSKLCVGSVQNFLDEYITKKGGEIDYIHGKFVVRTHSKKDGNIGFILPDVYKSDLFPTVIQDGCTATQDFFYGHAWDKRYYLECRKIR